MIRMRRNRTDGCPETDEDQILKQHVLTAIAERTSLIARFHGNRVVVVVDVTVVKPHISTFRIESVRVQILQLKMRCTIQSFSSSGCNGRFQLVRD
jgi:hypothetical protein